MRDGAVVGACPGAAYRGSVCGIPTVPEDCQQPGVIPEHSQTRPTNKARRLSFGELGSDHQMSEMKVLTLENYEYELHALVFFSWL